MTSIRSRRGPRPAVLCLVMLGLCAAALVAGCTGEIGGGGADDVSLADGLTPDGGDTAPDVPLEPDFGEITMTPQECETAELAAGVAPMRLLTRYEYDNTIRDLLGAAPIAAAFPPENLAHGFENAAYVHVASPRLLRAWLEAAEVVAQEAVTQRLSSLLTCEPGRAGATACVRAFVSEFGARAFRRPLDETERAIFEALGEQALEALGYEQAIALVLEAMLQSPQFLYRMELQDAAPGGQLVALDDWELASRLSYFLWSSMPDEALFAAASRGELSDPVQLEAHARRMLEDPRALGTVRAFYRQWLDLRILDSSVKDATQYPQWRVEHNEAWAESVLRFVEHVYGPQGQGTVAELMSSPLVFLPPELAPLYGISSPQPGLTGYLFDPGERAGLLTQPGVLAVLANPDQSSPIFRGVFVREKLLCQPIKSPPADLAIEPPDPDPTATTRERFRQHTESEACASCHVLIDPIGFGLEDFDGIGAWRSVENGLPVDASGYLSGVPAELEGEFVGAVELAQRLAGSETLGDCLAETWFRFALGRSWGNDDACSAFGAQARLREHRGDLRELLVSIVTSDSFRYRRTQSPIPTTGAQP